MKWKKNPSEDVRRKRFPGMESMESSQDKVQKANVCLGERGIVGEPVWQGQRERGGHCYQES